MDFIIAPALPTGSAMSLIPSATTSDQAGAQAQAPLERKPKILLLTTQLGYGGAETSFIRLANFLAQSMDVTVVLFTNDQNRHEALNAEIKVLDDAKPTYQLQRWIRRIWRLRKLKREQDAVISFLSGPNITNILAGYNTKTVVSLRGSRIYDTNASIWSRRIFQYLIDPITLNLAAKIVPVSAGLKNEIRQLAGAWTLPKVTVIPPFVLTENMMERAAENPPEMFLPLKNQPVIVTVARLSVEKNIQHLISVFAKLIQKNRGAKLLIIGDGPLLTSLRKQCEDLQLVIDNMSEGVSSVIFAGYQKSPLSFLKIGKVFAFSSSTEGLPNAVLEAMAVGIPVVAADTPWGVRAVLSNHPQNDTAYPTHSITPVDYGILMPRIDDERYAEEWVKILSECLQVNKSFYIEKGKQRVQHYDIKNIAPQWVSLIQAMMQK